MPETNVLFDVCGTLLPYSTTNEFVKWLSIENSRINSLRILFWFAAKIRLKGFDHKKHQINILKGLDRKYLMYQGEEFTRKKLVPDLRVNILSEWNKYRALKYNCYLLSGGLDIYLNSLGKILNANKVIATRLDFQKDICSGKIYRNDCVGMEKVYRVELEVPNFKNTRSIAIADSLSDLPLLLEVTEPVVVTDENWPKNYGFSIIRT